MARRTPRLVHDDQQPVARAACTNGASSVAAALRGVGVVVLQPSCTANLPDALHGSHVDISHRVRWNITSYRLSFLQSAMMGSAEYVPDTNAATACPCRKDYRFGRLWLMLAGHGDFLAMTTRRTEKPNTADWVYSTK